MEGGSKQKNGHTDDTEMADISLINRAEDELPSEAHSWYSANGRGYSVNGRQTEYEGDTSHVATVLGEQFYTRQKRNQAITDFVSQKPHPLFNIPSVALAILAAILLFIVASQRTSLDSPPETENQNSAVPSDTNVSPEGSFGAKSLAYDYRGWSRQIQSENGAVAADHGRCSVIGVGVLQSGGNAVDAAISTALCQGIMSPGASGLGGGHFMLIRLPNGTSEVINARETAPLAANETMFLGNPNSSTVGGLSIGVPIELKGFWLAHQRHGKASWQSLVQPSINLAELGFPAQPYLIHSIQEHIDKLEANPALREVFLIKEKGSWRAPKLNESCCVRPQLAALLKEVAIQGPKALYNSTKTEELAKDIQANGGIITAQDLRESQAVVEPALQAQAFGLDVALPSPPSSASVIMTALNILQGYSGWLAFSGELMSHRLVEAIKSAFALRTHLADPISCGNSTSCPINNVVNSSLSEDFANSLRISLFDNTTQATNIYGGVLHANSSVPEDGGTSHMSVVDKNGMAVSVTCTINKAFGSYVYSKSTGLLLNDEMDDFSSPGMINTFGLAPSQANFIRPGKRPLSSMSPLIFSDKRGVRIVVGASGGPRIISAMISTLVRLIIFGQSPLDSVSAPRLHHQLLPNVVNAEAWEGSGVRFIVSNSTIQALKSRHHNVSLSDWGAILQMIVVDPESRTLTSASDPRKDGAPSGY